MFIGPAFYFWASNAANIVAKVSVFVQILQGNSGRGWVPVNFPMCPMVFSQALKPLFTIIIPYDAMKPGFDKTSSHKLRNYILAALVS
jgi:hypothetical protein